MKRIVVSTGLVAIGAMSLHAGDYAPDFTAMNATKPWSVSGTLRGFYDDNYTTSPNGRKNGSGGFEFSPQIGLIMPLQQTELGLRYTYGLYYYQARENQGSNPIDQTHQVDLWIDHAFTQRLEGKIQDTFISQQDPELSSSPTALAYRAEGNNIENVGTVTGHYEFSTLFSTDVGYQNTWWDYQEHGATILDFLPGGAGATYAGLLNQDDHSVWANLNYQYLPDLAFLIGYDFTYDDYTGNELIAIGAGPVYSDNRNQMSHSVYVGAQYAMTANLSILANAGFEYSDNYNLPSFDPQSPNSYQPTANIAVTYTYLPGDYVQVGFTQSEASAPLAGLNGSNGSITLYQESSVIYATVNYEITPKLVGSVVGHYEYSTFVSGAANGDTQDWYSFGLNLAYQFTPFLSADAGYNFYYLTAIPVLNGYSRNIGYASLTASF